MIYLDYYASKINVLCLKQGWRLPLDRRKSIVIGKHYQVLLGFNRWVVIGIAYRVNASCSFSCPRYDYPENFNL